MQNMKLEQEFIRAAILVVMPDIGNGPATVPLSAVGFFDGSQAYLQHGAHDYVTAR